MNISPNIYRSWHIQTCLSGRISYSICSNLFSYSPKHLSWFLFFDIYKHWHSKHFCTCIFMLLLYIQKFNISTLFSQKAIMIYSPNSTEYAFINSPLSTKCHIKKKIIIWWKSKIVSHFNSSFPEYKWGKIYFLYVCW